jgi:hypothetical protein
MTLQSVTCLNIDDSSTPPPASVSPSPSYLLHEMMTNFVDNYCLTRERRDACMSICVFKKLAFFYAFNGQRNRTNKNLIFAPRASISPLRAEQQAPKRPDCVISYLLLRRRKKSHDAQILTRKASALVQQSFDTKSPCCAVLYVVERDACV